MQLVISGIESTVQFFLLFYAILIGLVCIGIFILKRKHRYMKVPATLPAISIIVACKNEERDLPHCIEALIALDYPKEKLEILLVDDDSSDSTASIIHDYAKKHGQIKYLNTKGYETSLKAKARGIALGADHASGEWMFITDADAIVPSTWLKEMLRGATNKTGIIGGMLTVDDDNMVGILEKMTWAYTLPYAFGAAGFGSSFICVGPNMALRTSLYRKYGGLKNVKFNIAEDLALFTITQSMGGEVLSHANRETTLRMKPVPSLSHLFSQHRRWLKGPFEHGLGYKLGVGIAFTLSFIFSLILLLAFLKSFAFGLGALGIKTIIDFVLYAVEKYHLRQKQFLRYSFLGSLYITVTMLWLGPSLMFNSVISWKGDGYTIKYD